MMTVEFARRNANVTSALANILIGDESALFFLLHSDAFTVGAKQQPGFSMNEGYAASAQELSQFNTQHPLFGGEPISVLVPERRLRIHAESVAGKLCSPDLPPNSAMRLREGLYIAAPGLVFVRMACGRSEACCAEMGMNLCARYYLDWQTDSICSRTGFLTTPEALGKYSASAGDLKGGRKASKALRWVLPNSGSPMETKMALIFRLPLGKGGFALPFDAMNFDVRSGKHTRLCEQSLYCIDMVSRKLKVGLEYDGWEYHLDIAKDMRRRNALLSMGWEIFPLDKTILNDAEATEKLGYQVAKRMGVRLQKQRSWECKYAQLRQDLGLRA